MLKTDVINGSEERDDITDSDEDTDGEDGDSEDSEPDDNGGHFRGSTKETRDAIAKMLWNEPFRGD